MNIAVKIETRALSRDEIEAALDASRLEIMRPQGDWVLARRRGKLQMRRSGYWQIPLWLENEVEGYVSRWDERSGYGFVRIADLAPRLT